MILTSHTIIGAALGKIAPSPLAALVLGILSHYAMDAIPHWEYKVPTISENAFTTQKEKGDRRNWDIFFVFWDLIAGIVFSAILFGREARGIGNTLSLLFGAFGGLLPDGLQVLYFYWKWKPLALHQKLHGAIHAKISLQEHAFLGISTQVILVALFVAVSKIL